MFTMRFDMRAPEGVAPIGDLYRAALEMGEWGEANGCLSIIISEHHASPDGYLPSPMILATAMVSRTRTAPVVVGALLLNLYDPIKLAEDMVILDILSGGRVAYIVGLGYRDEEMAMFGVARRQRGATMDRKLDALRRALAGEHFDYEGRPVWVTPSPATPGGPMLFYGGHSVAAARRAARFGLGLLTEGGGPELKQAYEEACAAEGRDPGMAIQPRAGMATTTFVANDLDQAWHELGPHMLHDARMYASWLGDNRPVSRSDATSVDELRSEQGPYRILTPEEAVAQVQGGELLQLQPLCGGVPPELAWSSLRLIGDEVLPALL